MTHDYDIVIVGGGLVGACLALALRESRYSVCVLEFNPPKAIMPKEPLDDRAIVLSKASYNILSSLGLWQDFTSFATPISDIHISNKGHFGAVRIDAKAHQVDAFGYVVLAQHLYRVLQDAMQEIDVIYGASFKSANNGLVTFERDGSTQTLQAKLVVGADGSFSAVRQQQGMPTTVHDYRQSVIICNVEVQKDPQGLAYERFTSEGPCALLPMADHTCAVVWATSPEKAQRLAALPTPEFITQLQTHFGYHLGKLLKVSQPFAFPLHFVRAQQLTADRLVLIGNASQTLHPIAGQGLNLGLRDMAALSELLLQHSGDAGDPSILRDYVAWRKFDQQHMMGLTHSLVTLFSNDFWPLAVGRSLGLMAMERLPLVRKTFAKATMGFMGKLPKMVCGIEVGEHD